MTVISSQRYRNPEIVEEKIEMLQNEKATKIVCPVCSAHYQDLDGNDLYVLINMHHTLTAARELGLDVEFEIKECPFTTSTNGEDVLTEMYMDSCWYYIQNDDENLIDCDVW